MLELNILKALWIVLSLKPFESIFEKSEEKKWGGGRQEFYNKFICT